MARPYPANPYACERDAVGKVYDAALREAGAVELADDSRLLEGFSIGNKGYDPPWRVVLYPFDHYAQVVAVRELDDDELDLATRAMRIAFKLPVEA